MLLRHIEEQIVRKKKYVTSLYVSGLVKAVAFDFPLTRREVVSSAFVLLKNVMIMRWFGFFSTDKDFPVLQKLSILPFPGK